MKYYLIEINTNWADEMDINAYSAKTELEFFAWQDKLNKYKFRFPVEMYIGTNEELTITPGDFKVREIHETEYKALESLKLLEYGFVELINDFDQSLEEDDEDDEDEDDEFDLDESSEYDNDPIDEF